MAVYLDRLYVWASDEVFQSNMLSGISFVPSATKHNQLRSKQSGEVKKKNKSDFRNMKIYMVNLA